MSELRRHRIFKRQAWLAGALALLTVICASAAPAQQLGWTRGGDSANDHVLASPLIVDLDNDSRVEIVVPSFDDTLTVYTDLGLFFAGTPGWPVTLGFTDGTMSSVAAGDVDGDGTLELVVAGDDSLSNNARVLVYEANGSLQASINLDSNLNAGVKATPTLVDCYRYSGSTRHDALEIVLRDGDGQLHVLAWNGTGFTDFFENTNDYKTVFDDGLKDRFGAQPINPSVAAQSLPGDQTSLVVGSTDGNVYRWNVSSTASANWVFTKLTPYPAIDAGTRFYSSVVLSDLDSDGDSEVIVGGSDGRLYVWDGNGSGSFQNGWPQPTEPSEAFLSSPAIADMDGDGTPEVVIGSNDGGVYAWHADGTMVQGWPVWTGGDVFGSPVVAELDGQAGLEVIAASFDGHLYAWTLDGSLLSRWPKRLNTPLYGSPAVGDLHDGGRLSVVTSGFDGRVFVFDLRPKSADPTAGWQQFRGDAARTGQR